MGKRVTAIMKMTKAPEYEPPKSGSHIATLSKITDLGIQKTNFGEKPQVRLRFDVAEKDSRGQQKFVTKTFTNSLHEKSNFVHFFTEIGKPLNGDDVETDNLVGIRFTLKLKQVKVDGKARVRIESVGPLVGGNGEN
jgi:hypothetical protein